MQQNTTEIFRDAPVPKAVLSNVIPSIISMIMVLIYNLADTFFIGQTKNALMVAAVSVATPAFLLFMAVGMLFGIGGTSFISRMLGEGQEARAKHASAFCFCIYVPDHGEECYEENRGFICRNHSAEIDWPLAHYEFEIPFWIYCSPKYIRNHRDIYRQIRKAKDKRFMTDALPHLLLYLAGIETPTYKEEYNILSPKYDEMRPRILKNSADYDKLRDAHLEKIKKEESKKVKKKERRN